MATLEAHRAMQRMLDNPKRTIVHNGKIIGRVSWSGKSKDFPGFARKPISDPVVQRAVSDLAEIMGRVRAIETRLFGQIREINPSEFKRVPIVGRVPNMEPAQ